jgi:opacity protein-like surface antigen
MKRIPFAAVTIVFLLAALVGPQVHAQHVADTHGFNLGIAANGTTVKIDDDSELGSSDRENGPGLTLSVGYNFMPYLGVFLSGTGASISTNDGDVIVSHGDLGLRLSFPGNSAFVPYVEAAYSALQADFDDEEAGDLKLTGDGFTGAAGFQYFFSTKVALDMNFRFTTGEFDTVKFDGGSITTDDGVGVKTGRLNVGVAWYPQAVARMTGSR